MVKPESLFERAILPELIGKFYSRTSNPGITQEREPHSSTLCEPGHHDTLGGSETAYETEVCTKVLFF